MRKTIEALLGGLAFLTATIVLAQPECIVADGVAYRIVRSSPASICIVRKAPDGTVVQTFPELARAIESVGLHVQAAMNGGIFEPGGAPTGLLIQDGQELAPLTRAAGSGNFFLKPNGVLLVGLTGALIVSTDEYPPPGFAVRHAVQSGPLLLRQGRIHPQLSADSRSRVVRNGVGVTKTGEVVLAISAADSPRQPTLHEFARLFRTLDCEDALYLDGAISQLRSGDDLAKPGPAFGSFIVVLRAE